MIKTMTRAQFNSIKAPKTAPVQSAPKTMSRDQFNSLKNQPKTMTRAEFNIKSQPQSGGLWRKVGNQIIKPLASASNALEDVGKTAGYGIAKMAGYKGSFQDAAKKGDINFLQHQKDVWSGKNQRTYSTIMNEIADDPDNVQNVPLSTMMRTIGYGGDIILDPLNKLKILGLTRKGLALEKVGQKSLSALEQATKGERSLFQIGSKNITPQFINKAILGSSTKFNDVIRGNKYGAMAVDALSKVSSKVRPSGINRPEWKVISDETRAFKKATEYASKKAIEFGADLEKSFRTAKATPEIRSAVLHAVEKSDPSLVPKGMEEIYKKSVAFKAANEEAWKQAGGASLDGYGLSHVATDEVAEQSRKKALGGMSLYSSTTPQDIHRQYVKVGDKVVNLKNEGIKYVDDLFEKGKGGFIDKTGNPVNISQATAKEINRSLVSQGGKAIFKEDLPTSVARMGISTSRKQAGQNFLRKTANIKSDKGLEIVNQTYEKLTNNEAVHKALKAYDKVLGVWKAQVLVAPSYHVRNEVGNIWNNYLAGTSPLDYANAAKMQGQVAIGKLDDASKALMTEMEQQGVIGGGWYGKDITQNIADEIGGKSWNPLSQRFGGYKANRAIGESFENNARIAHYLSKRRAGYSAVEAAKSVDKFLFDYGDLTFIEQNILKRVLPFYTWSSKNIPLQLEQFVKNPGKFSKATILQKDIEDTVSRPNEKYMSEYLKNNSPMRIKTNGDGSTEYLLLGQWIPAAQAIQFLSQPKDEILRGITPMITIPSDLLNNRSFFKDTLGGEEKIEKTPREKGSFMGFDLRKKTISVLRGIRLLNEIDKWNPGEIWGGKEKASIFQGLADNASEIRGSQHSPDSTQSSRNLGLLLGKTSTYNSENSKTYYDYDTQDRMNEYTQNLNQALRMKQLDLAEKIIKEMEQFNAEREGKNNKHIDNYNLMGDRYFEDLAQNKQAEYQRDEARKKMKEMIRTAIASDDSKMLQEALRLDPTYAKDAIRDALTEKSTGQRSLEEQKLYYELEQMKTKKRLNSFY